MEARRQLAPNDASVYFYLSQIRNAFGDRTTPLPLAEKAVALAPKTARYHRQLAEVVGVTAQHANAFQQLFLARRFRKEIDTALALNPNDIQALRDVLEFNLLAPTIVGGDRRKAGAIAGRIGNIDAVQGFLAQARIAAFEKRSGDLLDLLKKAVEAGPNEYGPRIALAEHYLEPRSAKLAEAEAQAKTAAALNPGRVEAYAVLTFIYAAQSRWTDLDKTLAESSHQVADDLVPYYRAAERLIVDDHDLPKAEQYLRTYLTQTPEGNEPTRADAEMQLHRIVAERRDR